MCDCAARRRCGRLVPEKSSKGVFRNDTMRDAVPITLEMNRATIHLAPLLSAVMLLAPGMAGLCAAMLLAPGMAGSCGVPAASSPAGGQQQRRAQTRPPPGPQQHPRQKRRKVNRCSFHFQCDWYRISHGVVAEHAFTALLGDQSDATPPRCAVAHSGSGHGAATLGARESRGQPKDREEFARPRSQGRGLLLGPEARQVLRAPASAPPNSPPPPPPPGL